MQSSNVHRVGGREGIPGRICFCPRARRPGVRWRPLARTAGFISLMLVLLVGGVNSHAAASLVEHVVVIGCDGMGSVAFGATNLPNLRQLIRTGASTLHARGVMPTSSSPNWASMIMGAGPEQHGVTSNDWQPHKFEFPPTALGSGGIFPTIFGELRAQRPRSVIVCVHDWDGFGRLLEPRAPDVLQHVKGSAATAERAIELLRERRPQLTFIHFDDVDHAGHTFGWKSFEYFQAVEAVDQLIGRVLAALESTRLRERTVILVTADHGGTGKGHGGLSMDELEIPWILNGPGVVAGREMRSPVNTFDTAPTLARIFGLRVPDCWIGRAVAEALVFP